MSRPFGKAKLEGKAFESLSKIKKGTWKEMKGTFGEMKGAASSLMPMMKILGVMKFLGPLLKPINAILKVLMASIFKPLMPIFNTIGKMLMGLMPMIEQLGTMIGENLADILTMIMPLIQILIEKIAPPIIRLIMVGLGLLFKFMPLLEALFPIFILIAEVLAVLIGWLELFVMWLVGGSPGLIPAIEGVVEIIEILVTGALDMLIAVFEFLGEVMENVTEVIQVLIDGAITILTQVLEFLGKVMENITKIIKILIDGALKILTATFQFLGEVMENITKILNVVIGAFQFLGNLIGSIILGLIDGFVRGMEAFAAILQQVNNILRTITFQGGGGGGGGGGKFLGIFQHGTPFVPETGLAHLTRGEAVIPAERNPFVGRGEIGGKTIHITMNFGSGTIIADEYALEEFANKVKEIMFMELE